MDEVSITVIVTAIVLVVFFGGALAGHIDQKDHWHRITVERGLAQYCPDTGEWAWIGECE